MLSLFEDKFFRDPLQTSVLKNYSEFKKIIKNAGGLHLSEVGLKYAIINYGI